MSAPTGTSVSVAQLHAERELGTGGQGMVTLVRVPDLSPEPMAYKEYSPSSLVDVDIDALEQLVALPSESGEELRTLIQRHTAWPVATVHRDGAVCGFLMPAAPDDFVSYLRLPTGYRAQLLAMEFLLNPPEYMANVDLPVTERSRLILLCELARLLRDLHRHGVVVGDVSPKNVLISLRVPRCYLLDCDGVRVHGRSVLPQIETPDWRLPAGEEMATRESDRFKFGLLVIRLLRSDQSASDPALLWETQRALAELAARSRGEPLARPTWDEWIGALDAAIPHASNSVPACPVPNPPPSPPPPSPPPVPLVARSAPIPYPTPPAIPPPKRPNYLVLALVTIAGVMCLLIALCSAFLGDAGDSGADSNRGPGYGGSGGADASGESGRVGIVDTTSAGTDADTLRVAGLFDAYFQGINNRDWDTVLSLYDPAGVVDSTARDQRRFFIGQMETTVDSDVRLLSVRTDGDRVLARATFRSEQDEGYGPSDHPNQTCTLWDVTYALTAHRNGYRILGPDRASSDAC